MYNGYMNKYFHSHEVPLCMEWTRDIPVSFISVEWFFTSRRKLGVISKESAADMYGFNNTILNGIDLTIPNGYNANLKNHFDLNYNFEEKYNFQLERYLINEKEVRIYSPERTIVELIKKNFNNITDIFISLVKGFFESFKYNDKKLYEAASFFKVTNQVILIQGLV